ncbi:MAG: hypothetical protein WCK65_15745, partial [Rhodospirillaceae bacterium]
VSATQKGIVCGGGRWAITEYEQLAAKWLTLVSMNRDEASTLAQLRDLLLPKLMSGEIRLHDAEKAVENAI